MASCSATGKEAPCSNRYGNRFIFFLPFVHARQGCRSSTILFLFRSKIQEVREAWKANPHAALHKQPSKFLNKSYLNNVVRSLCEGCAATGPFARQKATAFPLWAKKVQRKQRDIKRPRTEIQKARRIAALKIYGEPDARGRETGGSSITCIKEIKEAETENVSTYPSTFRASPSSTGIKVDDRFFFLLLDI